MSGNSYKSALEFSFFVVLMSTLFFLSSCGHHDPRSRKAALDKDGWIGVYVQDLDPEMRRYLDLKERYGVLVSDIVDGSPAEDAGLRQEDVVLRFDGKRIRNARDLTRALGRRKPGDRVKLEIIRDGKRKKIHVRIGKRRRPFARHLPPLPPKPPPGYSFDWRDRPWLGVQLADLNQDLAQYFEVNERGGALILSVEKDSPAEEAGLKAGDIILRINDERVRDAEDVIDIIRDSEVDNEVELLIKRKGRKESLRAELERGPGPNGFYFDRNNWNDGKDHWREEIREWKDEIDDWKNDYERDLRYPGLRKSGRSFWKVRELGLGNDPSGK